MHEFAWEYATRFNSFGARSAGRELIERFREMARVPGLSAVELNYRQHITSPDDRLLLDLARESGLAVTALNLRFDPPEFMRGSLCHPDPETRLSAIRMANEAMDIASANQIGHVILWLGPDGFDVPFQLNYSEAWEHAVTGIRSIAQARPDVHLSIEYKPREPRAVSLIRTMSDALLMARDSECANVGVTLDVCHAYMAGETPALAAALAMREQRLVGIHLNDGYGQIDDGLMVGAVHWLETVELIVQLHDAHWNGTIYFDTFAPPDRAAAECAANLATVAEMRSIARSLDWAELATIRARQDAIAAAGFARSLR